MKVGHIRTTLTEEAIQTAFNNLLLKKDIDRISIKDVTELAQVNRATFYAHFQDKYALFDRMIEDSIDGLFSNHAPGSDQLDSDSLSAYFEAIYDYLLKIEDHCPYSYQKLLPKVRQAIVKILSNRLNTFNNGHPATNQNAFARHMAASIIYEAAEFQLINETPLKPAEIITEITRFLN